MAQDGNEAGDTGATPTFLEFNYQKSPHYRAIHVDGFYGGPTPRGLMCVSFFNERQVIPRRVQRRIISESDGLVVAGQEEVVESLDGILRHLETTVFMDVNAARDFFTWFEGHLRTLEENAGVPEDQRVTRRGDNK